MKRMIILFLTSLLVLAPLVSSAQVNEEIVIRNTIDAYNAAYINERLDIMLTYIDKDSTWFKNYEYDLSKELKENKFISIGFDMPLEIKINNNSATAQTYGFTHHFEERDNFLWLFKRGFTYNLIKKDGQWKIESLKMQIYQIEKDVELALDKLRNGDPAEAMNLLSKARETNDKWETTYFLQAFIIFYIGKNYENALGGFLKTLEINPNFELAYYYAAKCFIMLNKKEDAIKISKLAIENSPNNVFAYYYYALTLEELGEYDKSIEAYNKLLLIAPGFYHGYYGLGTCYLTKNMFKEAIHYLGRAFELNPNSVQIMINLSGAYAASGQYQKAIEISEKALAINDKEYIANFYLGQAYMNLGDKDNAKINFEKVIAASPNSTFGKNSKVFLDRLLKN